MELQLIKWNEFQKRIIYGFIDRYWTPQANPAIIGVLQGMQVRNYTLLENVTVVEKYFWASQRFAYINILVHEKGPPFMWKQWKAKVNVIRKILF